MVRSMYFPAALHGVEAAVLASDILLKLRSSICRVVWVSSSASCVGAVLGLLYGPTGCNPLFCVVWFRFRLFRRFLLALWPSQVGRAYRLLEWCERVALVIGPIHLLSLLVLLRLALGGIL